MLTGRLGSLDADGSVLRVMLVGAARAPPMRNGSVRECRTTVAAAGILASGLDRELPSAAPIIVRIEVEEGLPDRFVKPGARPE